MKVWNSAGMERYKTLGIDFIEKLMVLKQYLHNGRKSFENVQYWIEKITKTIKIIS